MEWLYGIILVLFAGPIGYLYLANGVLERRCSKLELQGTTALAELAKLNAAAIAVVEAELEDKIAQGREDRISQIAEAKAQSRQYCDDSRRASDMAVIAMKDLIADLRSKVLEEFVPWRALNEMDKRITLAFEKVDGNLERLNEKLDRLVNKR